MMKMISANWRVVLAVSLLVGAVTIVFPRKKHDSAGDFLKLDLHAFQMTDGWGYEVLVDKKIFIHQDCIPAIPSYKKFSSETDALVVGSLVIEKIKHGHKPGLTQQDIKEAHIHY
ncbi:MAG: DUF4907 domain-containing protein [Chitinophagaceae bacterium]